MPTCTNVQPPRFEQRRANQQHSARYHDPIIFSCNRANEFESGCEDDVNCACTVKVNCRNMRTLCNSEWDRRSALLDWESDHSPYHEGFKQIRVVSRLKPPIQTCPVSHEHFQPSRNPPQTCPKKKNSSTYKIHCDVTCRVRIPDLLVSVLTKICMPPQYAATPSTARPSRSRIPSCSGTTLAEMRCC